MCAANTETNEKNFLVLLKDKIKLDLFYQTSTCSRARSRMKLEMRWETHSCVRNFDATDRVDREA